MRKRNLKKGILVTVMLLILVIQDTLAQSLINVQGSRKSDVVYQQIEYFLAQLDITEKIHLTVTFSSDMPESLWGMISPRPTPNNEEYQVYKMFIDAHLDNAAKLIVMAHELVHLRQYVKKDLVVDDEILWKGRPMANGRRYHRHAPWEKEAHGLDRRLVGQWKAFDSIQQEILVDLISLPEINEYICNYL